MSGETAGTPRTQDLRREIAALPHFGQHGFSAEAPWEIVFKRFSQIEREVAALTAERDALKQKEREHDAYDDVLVAELDAAKRALAELVACKDLKDYIESPGGAIRTSELYKKAEMRADYARRKPLAWAAARTVLATKSTEKGEEKCG